MNERPTPLFADVDTDALCKALLNVSLTGVILFRPVYGTHGLITDLAYVHLNPTARQMLGLPQCPAETFLTLYPHTRQTGIFAFYRDTFLSGKAGYYEVNYSHDGLDNYYHLSAQPSGPLLVVSFTDTAEQDRTNVEVALRESQAREQAASQQVERERSRLKRLFMQAPAAICILDGPDLVYELVNPGYQQLFPNRALLGKPLLRALPELQGHAVWDTLQSVYQTGESHFDQSVPIRLARQEGGELEDIYFNYIFQPRYDEHGDIDGVLVFAFEVTEQVVARQQAQVLAQELEMRVTERTQALQEALQETEQQRQQLREQQGLLQRILGQVPASLATLTGPDHRFSFFNPHYQALVGFRAQLGQRVADLLPEVIEQGFIGLLDNVYTTGKPFIGVEMPIQFLNPATGRFGQHYLDFIYQPTTGEQGQTTGILAFVVDVTEKVEARQRVEALQAELLAIAQQQAQERENFYQVFEQAPVIVALLRGPHHFFHYCNPAFQALFPGRALTGHFYAEVMPEIVAHGLIAELDCVYTTGNTFYGSELPVITTSPDGSPPHERYYDFSYQAHREDGQIAGISIFAHDATERVESRRQAEAQRIQLQHLFEQAPVAICVFRGANYRLEVVNPLMRLMLGRPLDHLVGRPFFEAMPDLVGQGLEELLNQVQRTGMPYVAQEQAFQLDRHRPEEWGYFNFVYQPLRNEHGQLTGITCVAIDVSEQVRARQQIEQSEKQAQIMAQELAAANEKLRATNEELEFSNQQLSLINVDLDNFIYTASHDLKAPIVNIEGLLQLLLRILPAEILHNERTGRIAALMRDSVERFKKTIANLTEVVKLQKENNGEAVQVSIPQVISDVLLDMEPLIASSQAQITTHSSECPLIHFSEKNLRSVIYNLVSNALKYRSSVRVPLIRISFHQEPAHLVLSVSDNGLGMNSSDQSKLFSMFKRFHDHVEGSGIGLYMVKKIVENAGGRIEVNSQVEVGTTFQVYFPQ